MTDERLPSRGNVRFRFYPDGAFANPYWPTVAELNAGQELEGVTLWENFEIGAQASETSDVASIKAKSAAARRGGAQFGGSASFWHAGDHTDMTNLASLVYLIMKEVNRPGYLVTSIDGEIGETGQPPIDFSFEDGDYISIFKIMTDEWDESITGEEAFHYTRNFIKNGMLRTYSVASDTAPVLTLETTGVEPVTGLKALVNGRDWTRGVRWTSNAIATASVSPTGVITKGTTAGSATITATLPRANPAVVATETIVVA